MFEQREIQIIKNDYVVGRDLIGHERFYEALKENFKNSQFLNQFGEEINSISQLMRAEIDYLNGIGLPVTINFLKISDTLVKNINGELIKGFSVNDTFNLDYSEGDLFILNHLSEFVIYCDANINLNSNEINIDEVVEHYSRKFPNLLTLSIINKEGFWENYFNKGKGLEKGVLFDSKFLSGDDEQYKIEKRLIENLQKDYKQK